MVVAIQNYLIMLDGIHCSDDITKFALLRGISSLQDKSMSSTPFPSTWPLLAWLSLDTTIAPNSFLVICEAELRILAEDFLWGHGRVDSKAHEDMTTGYLSHNLHDKQGRTTRRQEMISYP